MKAKNKLNLKRKYKFEAELFPASIPPGMVESIGELETIDLNELLAPRPNHVYMVRVNGESMIDENIFDGDILIVDRNENPQNGSIIIASLNGELAVKTFRIIKGKAYLISANQKFLPIEIGELMQFEIQGVVKHVIRNLA